MSCPTLLHHLDDDPRASVRLDQALALARRHEGHLIGLSCRRPAPYYDAGTTGGLGLDSLTLELARARQLAQEREQDFLDRCKAAGLASFEAVTDDDEPTRALVRRARSSDLVILGQVDPDDPERSRRRAVVDEVVLRSARPILVLPYAGRFESLGERVLIAWDDSQQAARALADALPMIKRARQVNLVQFDRTLGESGHIDQTPIEPVVAWLARHGVNVRGAVEYTATDIGNALLSQVADVCADLLVMGAWGQSRLTERLLGGCTRTVFESMTVPVLTSH